MCVLHTTAICRLFCLFTDTMTGTSEISRLVCDRPFLDNFPRFGLMKMFLRAVGRLHAFGEQNGFDCVSAVRVQLF